ncbi:g2101 [Coccomyxa viridis]|uniref:Signal recognition particle receptor subunit beta n=1 Tax=Coccomyxa viridis TaxID=1274662 RepID=A0ABP1FRG5_9CHLO
MLGSTEALYILLALGVILCIISFILQWTGKRGDSVLLVGHNGAGKTALFLQLERGEIGNGTVTSMKETVGFVKQDKREKQLRLVDVPGHPRISKGIFAGHTDRAKGFIFVVDSVDFMVQKDQVAEQLYDILASKAVSSRQMPVLLLANKADMGAKAHSVEFIRKRLEKALDQLRTTRADVEAESGNALEKAGEPFTFAGLARARGAQVVTASCSALQGDIAEVTEWLSQTIT